MGIGANGYRVRIDDGPGGWRVAIEDAAGAVVLERACGNGMEASTVRQHIYWLSPAKFREFYRV